MYDSGLGSPSPWLVFGGTSAAAPFVAGAYELARSQPVATWPAATLYAHRSALFDVTSGSNGGCVAAYLCNSVTGYDGPTGLGTLNGIGGFQTAVPATRPGAPTGVTATAGKGTATVHWTAPASNGGSAITGYAVRATGPTQIFHTFAGTATTQTFAGLTNGATYVFAVAAIMASVRVPSPTRRMRSLRRTRSPPVTRSSEASTPTSDLR